MFSRRKVKLPELAKVGRPELPEVRLRELRLPEVKLPDVKVPEVRLPDVQLPEVRLRDVQLPEVRLRDVQLPQVRLPDVQVPEVRLPSLELAGLRTPELELGGRAPFVRRRRSNPVWTGLKFALGLGLGLAVGCLVAALLAPAAGEDIRQMLRERVRGRGQSLLPDEAVTNSGAVTRGMRVSTAGNTGPVGELRSRFEAAQAAMEQERRTRENDLWVRFRRAVQTGRSSEV